MSESQAHARARKLSRNNLNTLFIVIESGEWDVCNEDTLETFYAGLEPVAAYHMGREA